MSTTVDQGEDLYWAWGVEGVDGDMLTATHEAGHVWCFAGLGEPFRYVTTRPRVPGLLGRVATHPRRISYVHQGAIALSGPVAEALYVAQHARDTGQVIPTDDDLIDLALSLSAAGDGAFVADMDDVLIDALRTCVLQRVHHNFAAITRLAGHLAGGRTLTHIAALRHLAEAAPTHGPR